MSFKAIVFGPQGPKFTKNERDLIMKYRPLGIILFKRNCQDVKQIRGLTNEFRDLVQASNAMVMIDQEGDAVTRLKAPLWPNLPAFNTLGALVNSNNALAEHATRLHAQATAAMLREVGVNVITSPCLDLQFDFGHKVIGSRAFSDDYKIVSKLGQLMISEFKAQNIATIIKHLPGHGRAMADSHLQLPLINASLSELERSDFIPFSEVMGYDMAMVAHLLIPALDKDLASSQSKKTQQYIVDHLKIKCPLISDSIEMQALSGSLVQRSQAVFAAGYDIVLSGKASEEELAELLENAASFSSKAFEGLNLPSPDHSKHSDAALKYFGLGREIAQIMKDNGVALSSGIDHTA